MKATHQAQEEGRARKPAHYERQNQATDQASAFERGQPQSQKSARLPDGPASRGLRQAAVLRMQRTHGNAFVARQLAPAAQRQEEGVAATEETGAPTEISSGGSRVAATGAGVEIEAPGTTNVNSSLMNVNSAVSRFSGIIQADTIIAQNVVGSNYTPGAGNIW